MNLDHSYRDFFGNIVTWGLFTKEGTPTFQKWQVAASTLKHVEQVKQLARKVGITPEKQIDAWP